MSTDPDPASRSPFLDLPGAVAADADGPDAGAPAHHGALVQEQRALAAGTAVVDLSHRAVLSVTGEDRLTWLDSITSQSLRGLAPGDSAETLFLDQNGRLEHAVGVLDDGVSTWLLLGAADAPALLAYLQRMRFMLRVEPADRTAELAVVGTLGEPDLPVAEPAGVPLVWRDPWARVVPGGHQYATAASHPAASWTWSERLVPRTELPALAARVAAGGLPVAGTLAAEALRIAAWRPRFATEVDDRTIPHELDWLRSAVHLSKGCYRGQETVAKVHNLGRPPRRLVLLQLDGSDAVLPGAGSDVRLPADADGAPGEVVGSVTSSALHHELGPIALAVVRRNVDPALQLEVVADDVRVQAMQDVIVPTDAGRSADVPRLPRLGAVRR
ncbi:YgfZ/GcvT domain-containing protein [Clavibacter michiganensis]|uniref:CAF17-like 4Fe-4S cluster assembly/insertion protein YgfZ n=1 Tax=Clavibacter michiganensis TaxID=28447 RepID=UPI0005BAC75B|nr:folate-binding protein YgfZ [Clavibacter michiganensis]